MPNNEGFEDHMHMHCSNIVSSLLKRGLHPVHVNNILGPINESIVDHRCPPNRSNNTIRLVIPSTVRAKRIMESLERVTAQSPTLASRVFDRSAL